MARMIVDVELKGHEALKRGEINKALRVALRYLGREWRRRYLKRHFQVTGFFEYGFRQRTAAYQRRKKREFPAHAGLPNVYTGELRRKSLFGPEKYTAKATSTRAYVQVHLPQKANFRMHELQRVSGRELQVLERIFVKRLEQELNRRGAQATASVGIKI